MHHFWLLSKFFCLVFKSLIMMCLARDFVEFILPGIHAVSWLCRFKYFTKFKKFSATTSLKTFSVPLFFLSLWNFNDTTRSFVIVPQDPKPLWYFFQSIFPLLFRLGDFFLLYYLPYSIGLDLEVELWHYFIHINTHMWVYIQIHIMKGLEARTHW